MLAVICACIAYKPPTLASSLSIPPFLSTEDSWVDSTLVSLTLAEKLGQLFIIQSNSKNSTELNSLIQNSHPGGILLTGVSVHTYITNINKIRRNSTIPLLEVSDQVLSIHNQFSNLPNLPNPATLSAIDDKSLHQSLQNQLLKDLKALGINCSFSPNFHIHHPEDKKYAPLNNGIDINATLQATNSQIAALHKANILSIVQGIQLPPFSGEELPEQFKQFKSNGLSGVLFNERIFQTNLAAKQPEFLKSLLQEKLDFEGLIIGQLSSQATFIDFYYAGADLFIATDQDLPLILKQVKYLVERGIISRKSIDEKVKRILLAKAGLGLKNTPPEPLDRTKIIGTLRATPNHFLEDLYKKSAVIIPAKAQILPLATTYGSSRHIVHVSKERMGTLQRTAFEYVNASPHLYRSKENGAINPLSFEGKEATYIIALDHLDLSASKNEHFLQSINELAKNNEVVLINYGNPFNLGLFSEDCTLLHFFENNTITEKLAIQILYGSAIAQGTMPIGVSARVHLGYQQKTNISRLKHVMPEEAGMKSEELYKIEDIVSHAIQQKAMPGCQVLIAKNGQIVYSKAFGHHTYEQQQRVEKSDIYDVASVTKVAATTLAMMKLYEDGLAGLDIALGEQMELPPYSRIKNIKLKELLIHKSGLQRNMPIAPYLRSKGKRKEDCQTIYCTNQTTTHSQKIADQLYFNPQYQVEIWKDVNRLERAYKHRKSLYGDVNFYLLQQFIEAQTATKLDEYVNDFFYQPLGLRYSLYNPLNRFPKSMIVPTEDDQKWRGELVKGTVHDETAALHSGIGGNAGLFSNAEDLAILFQMLLNEGTYGKKRYLQAETIELFTSATHGNHRGLGFDKPLHTSTISKSASSNTYGHNGFTGTCVWVDPDNQLVYIFLSNRIHPSKKNPTLYKLGIRRKIHDVIYQAIDKEHSQETLLVNISGE